MNLRTVISLLLISFLVSIATDSSAQRKRKRHTKREAVQKTNIADNINYEIKIGNLNFNQIFYFSGKANAGYKIMDRFSAGLGTKFYYAYSFVNKASFREYAGLGYARFKIMPDIYLQAEYNYHVLTNGKKSLYPSFGAGYMRDTGERWSYGAELFYLHRDVNRTNPNPFEYWFNFSYNF